MVREKAKAFIIGMITVSIISSIYYMIFQAINVEELIYLSGGIVILGILIIVLERITFKKEETQVIYMDNELSQMKKISKRLNGSVEKAEKEMNDFKKSKEDVTLSSRNTRPPMSMKENEKDSLMMSITEDIIAFSRKSKKEMVTKKERDTFIDTQLKKLGELSKMDISARDKILITGTKKFLERTKNLPVKT